MFLLENFTNIQNCEYCLIPLVTAGPQKQKHEIRIYLTILSDQKIKARQNEIFLILHFGQQEAFQAELYIVCMYTKNRSNLIAKTKADVSSFFCWT